MKAVYRFLARHRATRFAVYVLLVIPAWFVSTLAHVSRDAFDTFRDAWAHLLSEIRTVERHHQQETPSG